MKIDQFTNFTADKINDLLESRFGQSIDHFIEIVGDVPLDSINSQMVFEYKQKYLKIPNRRNQNPKYAGKTIDEILKMNPT